MVIFQWGPPNCDKNRDFLSISGFGVSRLVSNFNCGLIGYNTKCLHPFLAGDSHAETPRISESLRVEYVDDSKP